MCRICTVPFEQLNDHTQILIHNCNKIATVPVFEYVYDLEIDNCPNIMTLPDLPLLKYLNVYDSNIKTIPLYPLLLHLTLMSCKNISNLPLLENIKNLYIYDSNIISIPEFKNLKNLTIKSCSNIYDLNIIQRPNNTDEILQFNSINKIKKWYKQCKLIRKYYD